MTAELVTKPPPTKVFSLTYPIAHVLLITINREKARNSIPVEGHWEGDAIFEWFDQEASLRVAIIAGAGEKAFCAGQDLAEQSTRVSDSTKSSLQPLPVSGFAGFSRRRGKKPVIAAVNGFALGGGFEICLNSCVSSIPPTRDLLCTLLIESLVISSLPLPMPSLVCQK